jgi:hypothetical protein
MDVACTSRIISELNTLERAMRRVCVPHVAPQGDKVDDQAVRWF